MDTFNKSRLILTGIVCLLLTVSACSQVERDSQPEIIIPSSKDSVISLKEVLPEIQRLAQDWHTDAYLISVDLPIGFKDNKPYDYAVSFASPSDRMAIDFMKLPDGSVRSEYFSGVGISPTKSITESDWKLDSLDVFNLAYEYLQPEYALDENGHICGTMGLMQNPNLPGKPVVWRVYFDSCTIPTPDLSGNIIIDPISGAEILRETPASPH